MGEKSYFATIKCIIYDFIDKNRRIFASVKTNGRCETSFHHLLLIQINYEKTSSHGDGSSFFVFLVPLHPRY